MSTLRLKVFISSVQKELHEERIALGTLLATDPFLSGTTVPRLFEEYPAPLRPNKQAYLALLRTCNVYLLVLGKEYGTTLANDLSATHEEYRLAQELHLPTLVCLKGDARFVREDKVQAFLEEVRGHGYTYSRFHSTTELLDVARARLIEHICSEFDTQPTPLENQVATDTRLVASPFERQPSTTLTVDDLDPKLARDLMAAAEDKPVEKLSDDTVREALVSRGYLWFDAKEQVYRPTLAAVLLLARSPSKVIAQARLQLDAFMGEKRGANPLDSVVVDAPLPQAIEQAVAFIRRNTSQPLKVEGLKRARAEAYPQEALREALANAVAHRDYAETGAKITVEVFADRVVVGSPGRPPGNQSMAKISQGEARSRVRNPLVVQGLTWLGFMDERGSGIRRMQRALAEQGGNPPKFELNGDEFTVSLFALTVPTGASPESREPRVFPGSDIQEKIVRLLDGRGWTNSGQITQKLGIAKDTAVRHLNDMISSGWLKKQGSGRSTRYVSTLALRKYFSSDL